MSGLVGDKAWHGHARVRLIARCSGGTIQGTARPDAGYSVERVIVDGKGYSPEQMNQAGQAALLAAGWKSAAVKDRQKLARAPLLVSARRKGAGVGASVFLGTLERCSRWSDKEALASR